MQPSQGDQNQSHVDFAANLAHEQDRVEDDQQHDEVLKGWRGDKTPDVVADSNLSLRNVDLLRFDLDHVGDAGFLKKCNVSFCFCPSSYSCFYPFTCLILVNVVRKLRFTKFVKCNNHKSNKNVDKEKGKHHKVDYIVYGHFCAKPWNWSFVFKC